MHRETGHGTMDRLKLLTGVDEVGTTRSEAKLQAVDSSMLNRMFRRLGRRVLRMSPP